MLRSGRFTEWCDALVYTGATDPGHDPAAWHWRPEAHRVGEEVA